MPLLGAHTAKGYQAGSFGFGAVFNFASDTANVNVRGAVVALGTWDQIKPLNVITYVGPASNIFSNDVSVPALATGGASNQLPAKSIITIINAGNITGFNTNGTAIDCTANNPIINVSIINQVRASIKATGTGNAISKNGNTVSVINNGTIIGTITP